MGCVCVAQERGGGSSARQQQQGRACVAHGRAPSVPRPGRRQPRMARPLLLVVVSVGCLVGCVVWKGGSVSGSLGVMMCAGCGVGRGWRRCLGLRSVRCLVGVEQDAAAMAQSMAHLEAGWRAAQQVGRALEEEDEEDEEADDDDGDEEEDDDVS
eukprot:3795817-Rhodomonas_salina.4